uniref:exo-alpha-sialidase n=1 Tax=Pogona vitticeps TaxID=103695 RepID=A0A6J0TKM1_9SAUR
MEAGGAGEMGEAWNGTGKVVLFRQETLGGLTYRIPALLYLPSESTFLAFAEERSSPRDEDAKFLVMRRGQKAGKTVKWGPMAPLETATLPGHRTMNPCPVYERNSRTVFLFFICVESRVTEQQQISKGENAARLCYILSRNGGRTWSPVTDVTERAITDNLRKWATFAVGPGHGLQLSSGRLVIPAYAYFIHRRCLGRSFRCWTKPHCFTFHSDDGGKNWTQGQLLKTFQTSECQVAELTGRDNRPVLYCNARSPDRYRIEAFSTDGGDGFLESFLSKQLFEPPSGCQGSVVSFSPPAEASALSNAASLKNAASWLIFSHPTSRDTRTDLGIYLNTSPLDPGSWKAPQVLNPGPSGYSDLAVCGEGKSRLFGCLFECGQSHSYEEIAFQVFSEAEFLAGGP